MTQLEEVCQHYLQGRCRYGDECRKYHPLPAIPQTSRPNDALIKKKCNTFWETGECRHSFKCRYRHIPNPNNTAVALRGELEGWTTISTPGVASVHAMTRPFPSTGLSLAVCLMNSSFPLRCSSTVNQREVSRRPRRKGIRSHRPRLRKA